MDLSGVPIPRMDWGAGNLLETFNIIKKQSELIFKRPLKDKEKEYQVTLLLLWLGEKGQEIVDTLSLSIANKE